MTQKISKFTGSPEMEQSLDRMVLTTNEGFSGGRVTRHELVSWAVLYFEMRCFQECIEKIRQEHFDQVAYLESVLRDAKKARKEGQAMPDLSIALTPLIASSRHVTPRKVRGVRSIEPSQIDNQL